MKTKYVYGILSNLSLSNHEYNSRHGMAWRGEASMMGRSTTYRLTMQEGVLRFLRAACSS